MDETDRFLTSPDIMDIVVVQMLFKIRDPINKFIFSMAFLLNYKNEEIAECLGLSPTNISRRIGRIRIILKHFKDGYDFKKEDNE